MKSYLSLIPISAKVHRRRNRMVILCVAVSVFLVTAVFSMAEMAARQETARLVEKHGAEAVAELLRSQAFRSLLPAAGALFAFVLAAGILMISGSMNSSVADRTRQFGMMRCIGMSRRQVVRYVRLEALNWCRTAVPAGLAAGTAASWFLCAVLKYSVGGEWADIPQLKLSITGLICGPVTGVLTVLIAAGRPARRAASVPPVAALSGSRDEVRDLRSAGGTSRIGIETVLGMRHASASKKNLFLMTGSFALSIILFLSFSVLIDLVDCLMPQSASYAEIEIYAEDGALLDAGLPQKLGAMSGVRRAFGRRAGFDIPAECDACPAVRSVDIISFEDFDLDSLEKDGMLQNGGSLESVKNGGALLISDESIGNGDTIVVYGRSLVIAGRLKYDPFSADGSTEGRTTLIVPDGVFREMTGEADYTMVLVQLAGAGEEDVEAIRSAAGSRCVFEDGRESSTRGTYRAFIICAYSFLAIIAMVTVLNIVNSISMSVSARITQYGAMRAVGMSKKQAASMIRAEALTYAGLGCASGTVIGLVLSRWFYGFLVTSHFSYAVWQFPWADLGIITVFFAVSVAAGIRGPVRRIRRMSVTETLRTL